MGLRACKKCLKLVQATDEKKKKSSVQCPACGASTTAYWSGFAGIVDIENSEIAKMLGKKQKGMFAIKVR